VVVDAYGEVVLRGMSSQLLEDAVHHCRREFLRRQTVAAADDLWKIRHRSLTCGEAFDQRCDDVLIERLADRARLFGAVENGDTFYRRWKRLQEILEREGPHQPNLQHADFLPTRGQVVDRLMNRLGSGPHDDDDVLG